MNDEKSSPGSQLFGTYFYHGNIGFNSIISHEIHKVFAAG